MPDDVVQIQQFGDALAERAAPRASYLGRALSKAWARVFAGLLSYRDQQSDGLEAFDMLGGWKGSDARRNDTTGR